jgi:cell division septal protein FtsQ
MRRDAKILLTTACLGAVATWSDAVPEALATMEAFRIAEVEVRGARYLAEDEVIGLLRLTAETSLWSDADVWTERLLAHPMIEQARVTRRIPNGLLVTVTERTPIALAPTPTLEPIDAQGYRLPIDPAEFRLDLPVIETTRRPARGARLFPAEVRRLAAEVEHLMAVDTAFLQLVSSVSWDDRGSLLVRWTEPPVEFLLPPKASPARLREGIDALADALARFGGRAPAAIDLRFADQVVVRRTPATNS